MSEQESCIVRFKNDGGSTVGVYQDGEHFSDLYAGEELSERTAVGVAWSIGPADDVDGTDGDQSPATAASRPEKMT